MKMRTRLGFLTLLAVSVTAGAQPAPDMHVPSDKDNLTPYPLLAAKWGTDPAFTTNELILLARNLEALYGGSKNNLTKQKIDQIYSINKNFQVLFKTNLGDAVWQLLGGPVAGTGSNLTITNLVTVPRRFYRVQEYY